VRVDGNDVLAVYEVTRAARERAYADRGPTMIEAMTYRIGAHSTADDATRYRSQEEVEGQRALDPIERYRRYLLAAGIADESFVEGCAAEAEERVAAIRAGVIATEPPSGEDLFRYAFAEPPAPLERQMLTAASERGDD
jgi:TPP-dependent pyruvate/acetoin dehydrogenase alpha subunit